MNTYQALKEAEKDSQEKSDAFFSISRKKRDSYRDAEVSAAYEESEESYRRLVKAQNDHERFLQAQEEEGSNLAPNPAAYRSEREYLEALDKFHDSILGNF